VRHLSIREHGARTGPATPTPADVMNAVGASLLFRPVLGYATALEEWVRYPRPLVRNLLKRTGFEGELAVRTPNTTVLYMPESPEWRIAGYQEMIEFVAALPPLLRLWEREAAELAETLEKTLEAESDNSDEKDLEADSENSDSTAATDTTSITEIDKKGGKPPGEARGKRKSRSDPLVAERELARLEAGHRAREVEIRKELGLFHAQRLCRDRSQRQFIDALWAAAGLPELEADLDRRLGHLSALLERVSSRMSALAEQHRVDRAGKIERYFQLAGLIFAIASVAEVLSLFEAYGFERDQSLLLALLLAFVAVALLCAGTIAGTWIRDRNRSAPKAR
jgi:hypothetical protein